ncbi:MAG: Trp family transcriptional regulator [Candidatus Moranbacteria bacterium]|nr:Trp family transcriptional regulator [Candidatus Moranbacteria bacterium]
MGKVKPLDIEKEKRQEAIAEFFRVIEKLKSRKEMTNFFLGILTASEILMLARRIQIAQCLIGEKSYEEIQRKLRVGSETIHRTDQWLSHEDEKVRKWLKELMGEEKKEMIKTKRYRPTSLLSRYPHHRFWSDLLG